jgi:hypothetical protein
MEASGSGSVNSLPAAREAVDRQDSGLIERLAWHSILIAVSPFVSAALLKDGMALESMVDAAHEWEARNP